MLKIDQMEVRESLTFKVRKEVHKKFKKFCKDRDVKMIDVLSDYMNKITQEVK